jgi:RsiW-degrading membrane proteinase PrsW (M82 family)
LFSDEALAVAAGKGRTAMKNPIFWLALVAGNLAAAWIIVVWRYTGREHPEAVSMMIPLVLVPVCALLVLALAVCIVGRVSKLATK